MSERAEVPLPLPVNTLISFHYFDRTDVAKMVGWGLRVIGDSGAYSADSKGAMIDREAFWSWAERWADVLFWTASLDVIGNAEATWRNWIEAPETLKLVPTIHYGTPPETLDRYVERGADLIGLGGMVPFKSEPMRLLRWCASVIRYARDTHPHVRFHGWGITHPDLMMNLPWWSVDSSGFSAAYRYGRMMLFDPDTKRRIVVSMDGRSLAAHQRLLAKHYGVTDWKRVLKSYGGNRRDVVRISMRSMQFLETYLQARHGVTPPPSLIGAPRAWNDREQGPQVHFATTCVPCMHDVEPLALATTDVGPRVTAALGNSMADYGCIRPRGEQA